MGNPWHGTRAEVLKHLRDNQCCFIDKALLRSDVQPDQSIIEKAKPQVGKLKEMVGMEWEKQLGGYHAEGCYTIFVVECIKCGDGGHMAEFNMRSQVISLTDSLYVK